MSYLENLFNYSCLSKKAVHRETKITPSMLNKYFAFKAVPNPKTLHELFNLFWKHDTECCERTFIEQYDELSVNERVYYCFYAVTGKPFYEALGVSRQTFSTWSKSEEIPLKWKDKILNVFEKYDFYEYSVEELRFTQLADIYAKKYNFPGDFANSLNIPDTLVKEFGRDVFLKPIYELHLKERTIKRLTSKASVFTLYDLLNKSYTDFHSVDELSFYDISDIETIRKQFAKEYEAIKKYNAQITLLTPATYIHNYLNIYEKEFCQNYDNTNTPSLFFNDDETIGDFLQWDRWEALRRCIEEGVFETYEDIIKVQTFLLLQLGITRSELPQTIKPYSEKVPFKYSDKIKNVKFDSITDAEVNQFLNHFHEFLWKEQKDAAIKKRKTKRIEVFVDYNFIIALDFFAQMHFWVIDNTHENPSKSEPNTMKKISPKGYLNFFKTQTDKPVNMQLYLQVFQELEKAKGRFEFLSLDLDISQEYQHFFECSTFEGNTYLASKYNDSNEITDNICIEKDIFESRKVCINGLWDALRISIIIQDSDLIESLEKQKNIIEESDVSAKWEDLLKCYSVWGQMMEDLSIGDEFLAKDMYKKYNIEGYFIRLIFDEAVSMGVLSKTGKVFKLAKHLKI